MSKKLVVSDGTRERELQLVGRIVVGRDPACDVSHDHSLLSRRHAEFVSAGELVVVRDLGSRNGVFVNGTKTAEQSLKPGDVVQIGPLRAQYVVDRAPLSITPEDHDADRTAVIRGTPPAVVSKGGAAARADVPPSPPITSGAESAPAEAFDDDEATRLITVRQMVDTDATRSISAPPRPVAPRPVPLPSAATSPAAVAAAERVETISETPRLRADASARQAATMPVRSLRTFVFLHLLVLGALVLAAATFSFRVAAAAPPLTTFVVPVIVVAVGAYLVSGILDRRFINALQRNNDAG